jgi:hypothetical protein
MDVSNALPEQELLLARLTASKLGKVMNGLMSVGTTTLELESPADFLTHRDRTPLGFLEVLGCIGVKPGHADLIPLLRERVEELAAIVAQFHRLFMELTNWRSMPPRTAGATVERLADQYAQFCERLGAFCAMLGMDSDFSQQALQGRAHLVGFFQTCILPQKGAEGESALEIRGVMTP